MDMDTSGANLSSFVASKEIHDQLDQAHTIRYLSELVSCLHKQGSLASEHLQEIHLALSPFSSEQGQNYQETSLLLKLLKKRASEEWLELLSSIHSHELFISNLFRISCRDLLNSLTQSMSVLGGEFISLAKLSFNQPFYLQDESGARSKQLLSSVLIDLAMGLGLIIEETNKVQEELFTFLSTSSLYSLAQFDHETNEHLARNLGFQNLSKTDLAFYSDRHSRHRILLVLNLWVDLIEEGLDQLSRTNSQKSASPLFAEIGLYLEEIKEQLPIINKIKFQCSAKAGELRMLERKRVKLLDSIRNAASLMDKTHFAFLSCLKTYIKKDSLNALSAQAVITKETTKALTLEMVTRGVSPHSAKEAAQVFAKYCADKAVLRPESILPSELFQIHPSLGTESLAIIKRQNSSDTVIRGVEVEKSKILSALEKLEKYFQTALPHTCFLIYLFSSSLMSGCGVKTSPKSVSHELRPSIPFHSKQPPNTPQ